MSFLKSLAIDLFASKQKKVQLHVQEILADTITHVSAVEQQFQSEAPVIARACRSYVIDLPRGKEGFDRAYKMYFGYKQERSPLHASALIASKLILADHVCARAGANGVPSLVMVSFIQGYIEQFFERHGVQPWKARYIETKFFEAHHDEPAATKG